MAIRIVRLGTPRLPDEGLRLGTVRRPPRGVPKSEFARQDWYDVWYPALSPTPDLVRQALEATDTRQWAAFVKRFRTELAAPDVARTLDVLAALSKQTHFSVGCYCEDETRCHRSVLRAAFQERGADLR